MDQPTDMAPRPAPDRSGVTDARNALLSTAQSLVENYGNAFDGYKDRLIPIRQGALHRGQTLHDLEEVDSSISRPIPEKILAQENTTKGEPEPEIEGIDGVIFPGRVRMFVKWKGKSILRASWVDPDLWRELRRTSKVREEWVRRRRLIRKGMEAPFDIGKWEEMVRKDEELRWERRDLAILKRQLMDVVGVLTAQMEDEDRDFRDDMEDVFRRNEREERRENEREELRGKKRNRGEEISEGA